MVKQSPAYAGLCSFLIHGVVGDVVATPLAHVRLSGEENLIVGIKEHTRLSHLRFQKKDHRGTGNGLIRMASLVCVLAELIVGEQK